MNAPMAPIQCIIPLPLMRDRSTKGWRQSSRDGGDYRGASSILLGLSGEAAVERGSVHTQLLGDLPS